MLENIDMAVFGSEQANLIVKLKADLDRLHRERDNFHVQCGVQAEEIERLNEQVKALQTALSEVHDD